MVRQNLGLNIRNHTEVEMLVNCAKWVFEQSSCLGQVEIGQVTCKSANEIWLEWPWSVLRKVDVWRCHCVVSMVWT